MKVRTGGALVALLACTASILVSSPAVAQQPPSSADPNAAVASVNGEKITFAEWLGRMQMLRANDFLLTANPIRFKNATAGQVALEALVNTRLLLQFAKENKLLPSDAEINQQLATLKKDPAVAQSLTDKRVTEDQLRSDLRVSRSLYKVATSDVQVSQKEVQDYYDANKFRVWGTPELYKIALIRTSTRDEAEKAIGDLKKGSPWNTVVQKYSEDEETKKDGGVIGTSTLDDPGLPPFLRGPIGALKPGQNTEIIAAAIRGTSKPDFWIARVVEKTPATARPLNEVKTEVTELALLKKVGGIEVANRKVEGYRQKAKIEVFLPTYAALYKQ